MKIFLSAAPRDLKNARAWISNPNLSAVLSDLERAIQAQERSWGTCIIFVECTFPQTGEVYSNQVDLLIAFEDRAALVEVKQGMGGEYLYANVDDAVSQINNQLRTLKTHLNRNGIDPSCLEPFLWAPHLSKDELEAVVRQMRHAEAFRHIVPTGGNPTFRGARLLDNLWAYLPEALPWRLQRWQGSHPAGVGVATTLQRIIQKSHRAYSKPGREFATFAEVQKYLRGLIPDHNVELVLDAHQVIGLRAKQTAALKDALVDTRFRVTWSLFFDQTSDSHPDFFRGFPLGSSPMLHLRSARTLRMSNIFDAGIHGIGNTIGTFPTYWPMVESYRGDLIRQIPKSLFRFSRGIFFARVD